MEPISVKELSQAIKEGQEHHAGVCRPKILITVEGGMVTSVSGDIDAEIVVNDRDNIDAGDEEPTFNDGTTVDDFNIPKHALY